MDAASRYLLETEEIKGEHRANQVRLLVAALFLVFFAVFYLKAERHFAAGYVILADLVALFLYALLLRQLLAHDRYFSFLKYVSSAVDISCITLMAVSSLFLTSGLELQGWIANIAVFLLFIAVSGLRFSPGLCLFTGLVAVAEFLLLNLFVLTAGGKPLPTPQLATIAILLLAASSIIAFTARTARQLIVRAGLAERQRSQLATEASQARRLAITDELTGLYNRRHFLAELKREIARSSRQARFFAVLIIDLDHFKEVNDTLGHMAGDLMLRQIASILRKSSREADIVARFGGDEFSVLLCEADPEQAKVAAERMCLAVREYQFEVDADVHHFNASLSIGLACFPADATDEEGLLRAADRAVYHAKALGRDRVVAATA